MKKILILFVLLIGSKLVSGQVLSANPMKSRLDMVVDKAAKLYIAEKGRLGLSIGVVTASGKYQYHYGETAPGTAKLPNDHSLYEIGSITKTFTGLLVAKAITEGKMKLNADICQYLPGSFPNLHYSGGEPVKVGYLLSHTAQLPNNFTAIDKSGFMKELRAFKLDSIKPSSYAYSNAGYKLLGYALENVYQQAYAKLLGTYLNKLKMIDTRVTYSEKEMAAAGGLSSTLEDMLKYMDYQLAEADAAVKLSHRVIYGNVEQGAYGFQWAIGKTRNWDYYIRADGGTEGFRTFFSLYPNDRIGIVLLSNKNDDKAGQDLYRLTVAILEGCR
ncbi:serine hydrolase domain-containing protein [Pedobacter africanus]|nr:serine hydrolase domain-containing protein [Pedobacter africanus]